jgi:exocyst complex component 7
VQYLAALDVVVENLARGGAGGARAGVAVQLAMVRL